jgi:tRNA(Ile)-lysidine synthase
MRFRGTAHPEPVEGPSFLGQGTEGEGEGFDRLSPNGVGAAKRVGRTGCAEGNLATETIPPDQRDRFRADLGALGAGDARIGLAVSGGPDSLALLRLAAAARPGRIAAATVDHRLRAESGAEAAKVAGHCADLGVPHDSLTVTVAPGNVAGEARRARYAALGRWAVDRGLGLIATAHQRDDVAEGFLMRALRGSGVAGLARMAARGAVPGCGDVVLVRPLLNWSRAELGEIAAPLDPVDDPTNHDPAHDRARIRRLIADNPALDAGRLARAAAHLAEAEAALGWIVDEVWRSRAQATPDGVTIDAEGLPREIRRRLAMRAVAAIDPGWGGEGVDALVDALDSDIATTLGGVVGRVGDGGYWRFRHSPPRSR